MKSLKQTLLIAAVALSPILCTGLPIDGNIFFDGTNTINVAWNATPGKAYLLQTSTNVTGPWVNVLSAPGTITATTNQVYQPLSPNSAVRFYRVTKLDTDGPEVNQVAPFDGAIAVGQKVAIKASLVDETGINTNSISFQLGTNAPVTLGDSRLTFTAGALTYTPGTNEVLEALGNSVTCRISATDTLGNQTTNFSWSFQIELLAIPTANILLIGGTNGFVFVATNGDYYTFSYSGAFPGLTNGQQMADTNIYTGYTRTVVAFTNYPASNTVVVLTRPTKLAELLVSGSLSGAKFTEVGGSQLAGGMRLYSLASQSLAYGIPFSYHYDLKHVLFQNPNLTVEILTNSYFNWSGTFEISGNVQNNKLTQFASKIAGDVDFRVEAHVGAQGAIDHDYSTTLFTSPTKRFVSFIGGWPVWFDAIFELNAGYTAHLEGSADYTNGVIGTKEYLYGNRWDSTSGWSTLSQSPPLELSSLGPRWSVQGSGNLHIYLQPKVRLLVYSAVGMSYDLQPYADLEGRYQPSPYEFELALYGGMTGNMGVDLAVWDDLLPALPSYTIDFIPRTLLWETNNLSTPPQITGQPQEQWVTAGGEATFTVQANGPGPLSFRWQKYGLWLSDDSHITGTRSSTLRISNCSSNDVGSYRVIVSNPNGSVTSQNALLTVYPANIQTGMALIPAGSFTMGDTFGESGLHTVYVSAFYMDRYEVTKALWDDVYNWATNYGYSFDYSDSGQGKASNHPAHSMTWYDCVKWCNARSEMEGRTPAYYTDVAQTTVYRSGQTNVQNDLVKWNSGYRLPTSAEWEKAARGGASGQRFPWGNTINQSQANYYSYWNVGVPIFPYDVNSTSGYHPTFAAGGFPYTSPVGYFTPNGYGLYDMAGNVSERCWDFINRAMHLIPLTPLLGVCSAN